MHVFLVSLFVDFVPYYLHCILSSNLSILQANPHIIPHTNAFIYLFVRSLLQFVIL